MGLTLAPYMHLQFLSNAGAVLSGGFLYTYAAGTSTDLATYADEAGAVANANPILLNTAGRPWNSTVEINVYLLPRTYRFVLKTSAGVTVWDADNIPAVPTQETALDITGTAGEALSVRDIAYLSDGSGSKTNGRWYKADADNGYSSSTAGMVAIVTAAIASGEEGSLRLQGRVTGFTALSAGAKYYVSATAGAITSTPPSNVREVGQADSTTSLVVSPNPSTLQGNVDTSGTAGEALSAGDLAYLSDGSNSLTAGRWYKADADFYYASIHPALGCAPAAIASGSAGAIRTGGVLSGLSGLTAGVTYYVSATAGGLTATAPVNARSVGVALSTTSLLIDLGPQWIANSDPLSICDGRLTLTTALPVTVADVTGATTVYFAPYTGNRIALFDGSKWKVYAFTQITGALGTLSSGRPYDVFLYDNAGTLTLQFTAWTNDTARATALTTQDGVLVLTGSLTRRYLGTFYTTATTTTEDSFAKRFLWNYYNRVPRPMRVAEATDSWTYTTATWRQANAAAGNQLDFIIGVSEVPAEASVIAVASNDGTAANVRVGIGLDSTSALAAGSFVTNVSIVTANKYFIPTASYRGFPGAGRHVLVWLENSSASGTTTWYGDAGDAAVMQNGILGSVEG